MTNTTKPDTTAAATDVGEFVSELDGGQFERVLSIALSKAAAAVIDNDKKAEVSVKLTIERIKNTSQVRIGHTVKYVRPTMAGRASEETDGATVFHVGRYGALSLAQPSLLEREAQSRIPD